MIEQAQAAHPVGHHHCIVVTSTEDQGTGSLQKGKFAVIELDDKGQCCTRATAEGDNGNLNKSDHYIDHH